MIAVEHRRWPNFRRTPPTPGRLPHYFVCPLSRPGSFVFLGHAGDTFTVRRLIEDGAGDLCATDESHDLSTEHADNFVPAMSIGRF